MHSSFAPPKGSAACRKRKLAVVWTRFRVFLPAIAYIQRSAEICMTQIRFTRKEAKVLDVLERSPGEVVTRKFLLDNVFGYNEGVKTRTLDVHISKLRAKLAAKVEVRISAVRGLGYLLARGCPPAVPSPKQDSC